MPIDRKLLAKSAYSGAIGLEEVRSFRRNAARFRHLDEMAKELRQLKKVAAAPVE